MPSRADNRRSWLLAKLGIDGKGKSNTDLERIDLLQSKGVLASVGASLSMADLGYFEGKDYVAPAPVTPANLTVWRGGSALAATTPVDYIAVGDSLTEGSGATTLLDSYVQKTRAGLQAAKNGGSGSGIGFVNNFSNAGLSGQYWSGSNPSGENDGFLGARLGRMGPPATLTFTGTSFRLIFTKGNAAFPDIPVTIDGQSAGTIAVPDDGGFNAAGTWQSPILAPGNHTAVFGSQYLSGAFIYNGDETKGVRVWESGHYGWTTELWAGGGGTQPAFSLIQPKLVSIFLGLNDYSNGVNPATYQARLIALATLLRSYCSSNPSVVFISPFARSDVGAPAFPIASYVEACAAASAATADSISVDLSTVITPANRDSLLTDGVHPNNAGHLLIANTLTAALT